MMIVEWYCILGNVNSPRELIGPPSFDLLPQKQRLRNWLVVNVEDPRQIFIPVPQPGIELIGSRPAVINAHLSSLVKQQILDLHDNFYQIAQICHDITQKRRFFSVVDLVRSWVWDPHDVVAEIVSCIKGGEWKVQIRNFMESYRQLPKRTT